MQVRLNGGTTRDRALIMGMLRLFQKWLREYRGDRENLDIYLWKTTHEFLKDPNALFKQLR